MRHLFLCLLVVLAISCNKNNESPIILSTWPITKVEGPATGSINQPVALTVYWPYSSGSCDVLDKFSELRQGSFVTIKAFGHSAGGVCTADAGIKTKIYHFVSASPGTFELRFRSSDSSFITHTVTIN